MAGRRGIAIASFVVLAAAAAWVLPNREAIVAACLRTAEGITSKLAHMNEPFGVGAAVQSKNPVLGHAPDFSLTDNAGKAVSNTDLLGSYWIASFIFTRCASSCPKAVTELAHLQNDLPASVRLVSFSVDPEHDSPEVLAEYAAQAGARLDRWIFLTGERDAMYKSIREGFLLAVEENGEPRPGWEVTHSPRFALVDPKGRIRGYYDSSSQDDLARLRRDIGRLVEKGVVAEG